MYSTYRLKPPLVFALLEMPIDDEFQQSGIPNAAVVRVHGVGKAGCFLANAFERQSVIGFVQKLAQDSRLHETTQIGAALDHPPDNEVIYKRTLQMNRTELRAGHQCCDIVTHCHFKISIGKLEIALQFDPRNIVWVVFKRLLQQIVKSFVQNFEVVDCRTENKNI